MTSQRICSSGKPHEITTTQNQTSTVLIYKRHPAQPIETNLNQNRRNKIHKKMHNKIEKKNYTGTARCWRILLQILKLLQNSLRRHSENLTTEIETTTRLRSKRKTRTYPKRAYAKNIYHHII